MPNRWYLLLIGIFLCMHAIAQDNTTILSPVVVDRYIHAVDGKADQLQQKLDGKSEKLLNSLLKEEDRLRRKLSRKDTALAQKVFGDAKQQYERLQTSLQSPGKLQQYIPSLDTLSSSLKFLEQYPQLNTIAKDGPLKLKTAMTKLDGLESEFRKAEAIKQFLKERKQFLKEQLGKVSMGKELAKLNKQAYYYSALVNEYKQLLKDHQKAEKKALALLSKTQLFKDFMRKHSGLASLFRIPGDPADPGAAASLAGLQTRVQVNNLVQQQIAGGGPNAQAQFSQNMQQAQNQLSTLKNKLGKITNGGSDTEMDMPDGFKPNGQKTKSFFQRIELGANMQSQKSNGYFPVTSDIALTAGYKLNDKSTIGIGASYKMGWGESIRNIRITHQGIGLRSFIDIKLKGSFWLTGGYEMNYRSGFSRIIELRDRGAWQESGLIGLSKVIDVRSKLLKKTKVQLLWDLLSYRQVPKTPAVVFRVGYTF